MFQGAILLRFGASLRQRMHFGLFSPAGLQSLVSVLLIILLALQCARLLWAAFGPIGPLGDWRPATVHGGSASTTEALSFDPFFRLQPEGDAAVVTSLSLKLFGVRVDNASGRGSAIIETPDGVQSSFAVGDEIMPGVVLARVAFDNVTIDRSGVAEQIFLDQSIAAPVAQPSETASNDGGNSASLLANSVEIAPRLEGGKVIGMTLNPKGDGTLFKSAGLEPGDLLVAINGKPVGEGEDIRSVLASGSSASLEIERGGRRMTVSAKTGP
jgi:general secretion pathway protein C